ncbi:MAG: bifunctional DNA primase/polymerase, partial [Methylovulum sp.]|uniref:bifunctional DNA primase/polymerase n=1 Tax=Methylovulum sp. TaxID=1916980 RepID=UPI002607EB3A
TLTLSNTNGRNLNPSVISSDVPLTTSSLRQLQDIFLYRISYMELARQVFEELTGQQLLDWLKSPERLEIKSPKANRGKLLFKLPEGFSHANLRQFKHNGAAIFELRCGNCQDVILGRHPEGGDYQLIGNPAAIPDAPAVLLDMLENWEAWKICFDSVLGIAEPPKISPCKPLKGENLTGYRNPIKEFNQAFGVADVLTRNGYKQVTQDRFIRPDSSSKAPAVAIMHDCKDGVERVYSHGGDVLNDGFAHDAFDCFRLLEHGGEWAAALRWNADVTRHNQSLFMKEQSKDAPEPQQEESHKQPFTLAQFSLKGRSSEMEKTMLDDKFVLGRIAIYGQATAIYAKPNTGKTLLTLWLLIQAINAKAIEGTDVFYINADDNYRGLVEKLKLAERHGFEMLAPGHSGFEAKLFIAYMQAMVKDKTAHGKIIILDTLKKFTDLMDKKTSTEFMRVGRLFVANGGTLILLAHTNKNRNGDGKVVFGGTSDIVDDVDCAYTLDEISGTQGRKSVLFENIKARGDVAFEVGYTYSTAGGQTYNERLNSVESLDKAVAEQAKQAHRKAEQMAKDKPVIDAILEALEQGDTLKMDLNRNVRENSGFSKARINKVIDDYTGVHFSKGHRWFLVPGDKSAKIYSVLRNLFDSTQTTADEYRTAKQGEK